MYIFSFHTGPHAFLIYCIFELHFTTFHIAFLQGCAVIHILYWVAFFFLNIEFLLLILYSANLVNTINSKDSSIYLGMFLDFPKALSAESHGFSFRNTLFVDAGSRTWLSNWIELNWTLSLLFNHCTLSFLP